MPAPNLAALRGLNVPKALRPGILKAQAPHNAGGAVNLNEQEVLEDEDIRFRQFNDSALVDSPYDAYTQEQERKWI